MVAGGDVCVLILISAWPTTNAELARLVLPLAIVVIVVVTALTTTTLIAATLVVVTNPIILLPKQPQSLCVNFRLSRSQTSLLQHCPLVLGHVRLR